MQAKVPQNVQREDTIVGPLTMKQLIICGAGGGVAYAIYVVLARNYLWPVWAPPTFIAVAITLAFAFAKVHGLTFYKYILFFLEFNILPKKRVWIKGSGDVYPLLFPKVSKKIQEKAPKEKNIKDIDNLVKILDSQGAAAREGASAQHPEIFQSHS